LLKRPLKKHGHVPKRIVTDRPGSDAAAREQLMPNVEHRSHKGLNNRAENSPIPLRTRERVIPHARSDKALQHSVAVASALHNFLIPPRQKSSARSIHLDRLNAFAHWKAVTAAA
jgi:putative transposase